MKKFKLLTMIVVLSVALCACGAQENEKASEGDSQNVSSAEQKEADSKDEKKEAQVDSFECLPEMLEASPEDRLIQFGDVLLRCDCSMTLKETIEALENSSVEYSFFDGDLDDAELSLDRLIPGQEDISIEVHKDGEKLAYLYVRNTSTELVALSDTSVKLYTFNEYDNHNEDDFYIRYFKGLCDGSEELTIDSVKELMAEYEDTLKEGASDKFYSLTYSYTYETPGGEKDGFVSFKFDLKDGSFSGMSYYSK